MTHLCPHPQRTGQGRNQPPGVGHLEQTWGRGDGHTFSPAMGHLRKVTPLGKLHTIYNYSSAMHKPTETKTLKLYHIIYPSQIFLISLCASSLHLKLCELQGNAIFSDVGIIFNTCKKSRVSRVSPSSSFFNYQRHTSTRRGELQELEAPVTFRSHWKGYDFVVSCWSILILKYWC